MKRVRKRADAEADAPKRIAAPFGAANRHRLIAEFLAGSTDEPWLRIYKLLLWTDKTTGLAHCYESDKCQPGKPWHPRSLRFHAWLSEVLGVAPREAAEGIDWLFRHAADDYAQEAVARYQALLRKAVQQRAAYIDRNFPEPGEDPAIVDIIHEELGHRLISQPTPDEWRRMTQRVRELIALENKRKNLVGEGFEDAICAVVQAFDTDQRLDVRVRCPLSSVAGFENTRVGDKPVKVDIAVMHKVTQRRTLVTAKWSIRADRERQFQSDLADYVRAKSDMKPFDYVLLTNEFDPARLLRASEFSSGNAPMFSHVVHINPQALQAAYGEHPEPTMKMVLQLIEEGRVSGLDMWLARVSQP